MQIFHKGDWVRIAKDLGPSMSHFQADCEAIVIGSYADKYGGDDHKSYTLHLNGRGEVSWYREHQLTLIEPNRIDLLDQWEKEAKEEADRKGDLDWIFSNGPEVLERPHSASVRRLAACIGIDNLWGSRGEGITYYMNTINVLIVASPFLAKNDKAGWLEFARTNHA